MMPTAPAKTKTWFRPNGYLTDHQAKIIVNRSLRDDPAKGGMHNRQPLSLKMIRKSLGDWDLVRSLPSPRNEGGLTNFSSIPSTSSA